LNDGGRRPSGSPHAAAGSGTGDGALTKLSLPSPWKPCTCNPIRNAPVCSAVSVFAFAVAASLGTTAAVNAVAHGIPLTDIQAPSRAMPS
jgi:hypothetical protein